VTRIESASDIGHIAARFHTLARADRNQFESWKSEVIGFQKKRGEVYSRFSGFTYLPVQAFKEGPICCFNPIDAERVFLSSGSAMASVSRPVAGIGLDTKSKATTDWGRAKHYVRHLEVYDRAILAGFRQAFGSGPFIVLAHLPHYRPESSLVYMAQRLMEELGTSGSGFFLEDDAPLVHAIADSISTGTPILLLGAAFGLVDLVTSKKYRLPNDSIVIETGGMKTHRREITREVLHAGLAEGFDVARSAVRSEYGMCEMLSQFYTNERGLFQTPPWVSVEILDQTDFKTPLGLNKPGVLAVFDMANLYSQSAILTQDIAIQRDAGFEILGRLDQSGVRGCNLLLES